MNQRPDSNDPFLSWDQRRCIPCRKYKHTGCLGYLPGDNKHLWCECPCGTGEREARKQAVLEQRTSESS